ncbi:MAG: oxygen-independent coproporphyrinogen III oxidase [Puniceicoccales bacterium]|jgi:oxygen-independent coproporphyrinogen-3 oxidase|nr:oxygen-independent coproporphyrinogen III oxidase [Puniceicoccales bacterium]
MKNDSLNATAQPDADGTDGGDGTDAAQEIRLDLVEKYNVAGPRYTSYPTAVQFSQDIPTDSLLADATEDFAAAREISAYVHIPFCETLCWYCACNTITTGASRARATAYLDSLQRELALWQPRFPRRPQLGQLHFGGGTPTFLQPHEIDRLGDILHAAFDVATDAEVSVEIDPRRLTPEHLDAFHRLGATRASFGVQDFDPDAQKAINRIQPFDVTADAVRWARERGYTSVNFDLIYGLPHQTETTFARTLEQVVALAPDRLAVFSYAHVPWMRPAQKIFERQASLPSPERKLNLLKLVIERLTRAGYVYIGMDHFARPGDELATARREKRLHRNFQGYSTKAGLSLLGLGVSAISQTPGAFRQNEKTLDAWQSRLDAGVLPIAKGVLLTAEDKRRREIIMRIMCDLELDYASLGERLGVDIPATYGTELARLAPLAADGLVALAPDRLRVLPAGRLFLRNIAMAFDAYLDPAAAHHSRTI